jgi:hypothetical protein
MSFDKRTNQILEDRIPSSATPAIPSLATPEIPSSATPEIATPASPATASMATPETLSPASSASASPASSTIASPASPAIASLFEIDENWDDDEFFSFVYRKLPQIWKAVQIVFTDLEIDVSGEMVEKIERMLAEL